MNTTQAGARSSAGARVPARRRLSVLLLADDFKGHANTILEQLEAFRRISAHEVRLYNPRGVARSRMLDLNEFDVVVIHYSLAITHDHYLAPDLREKIHRFPGLKIQLIQDDYRWVDDITAMMRHLGIHVLFTLVPEKEIPRIWDETRLPGVEKITYLAGYVPEHLVGMTVAPFEARPLDIGYRGRVLPYWLGRIGQEKAWIAQGVAARAARHGLRCDVGWRESDRIYGRSWIELISSCKATLGSESGATITDFDGSIERAVKNYLAEHPEASFEEVHGEVLAPFEGNVRMNVISPRVFEAAALRTGLILFPGEYSGIVEPWTHYVPLAKDFSNWEEVVERLRDADAMKAMIARAHAEIAASGRYSLGGFIRQFDEVVSRRGRPNARRLKLYYAAAMAEKHWRPAELWRKSGIPWLIRQVFRGWLAVRFTLSSPPLLGAALRHLMSPWRWGEARPTALVPDLIRFGLLREALAGWIKAGEPFRVWAQADAGEGRLSFVSRPVDAWAKDASGRRASSPGPAEIEALGKSLQAGSLRVFDWNHSLAGDHVPYPVTASLSTLFGMGDDGIWRFPAIRALAQHSPRRIAGALMVLFRGESPESWRSFRAALAIRLAVRHRPLARLFFRWLRLYVSQPALRAELVARETCQDLFRLAILREAQSSRQTSHVAFRVTASFDPTGRRLRLVSRPVDAWGRDASGALVGSSPREPFWPVLEAALREGRSGGIEWDHSALGSYVRYSWSSRCWVAVFLDQDGTWRFERFTRLARLVPGGAWQAFVPILRGEPARVSWILRLAAAPGTYLPRAAAALSVVMGSPVLRRCLGLWLRNGEFRRRARLDRLLDELMKLRLIVSSIGGREGPFQVAVELDREAHVLCFRSTPRGSGAEGMPPRAALAGLGPLRRITWNHSAIGSRVSCPAFGSRSLSLSLEPAGVFDFQALQHYSALMPEEFEAALVRLAEGRAPV